MRSRIKVVLDPTPVTEGGGWAIIAFYGTLNVGQDSAWCIV